MNAASRCSTCGAELTDAGSGGLCLRCLLALGLETSPSWTHQSAGAPADQPGRIGRYQVVEKLGEGGMGIVYLAEQTEPFRRQVAVKVIKPGMDTQQVLARFETERQALAVMNHPNVARVLDAGVTEEGRPYFVMEFVAGIPITRYADLHCLSVRERLELFTLVCDGIQHAHQKGIIHRDVKPSNVLVASEDGKAVLKVIDFGVAKATGQDLGERALFTQQGTVLGTPEYMSPEQAGLDASGVDARSDIYSLGVLLYELLVGALPFEPGALRRAAVLEMLRIIREENPPTPTTTFSRLGENAIDVARRRQTDVRALARQLHGELEWITMRTLAKDPASRYPSASELATDVRRHLCGEPVAAGPPSRSYQLKKLVRKHRAAVATSAALMGVLLVGAVVSTSLYLRSESARRRAELEARRNLLEARALQSAFLGTTSETMALFSEALELHRQALGASPALVVYLANRLVFGALLGDDADRRQLEREALDLTHRGLDAGSPDAIEAAALLADLVDPSEADRLVRRALALEPAQLAAADEPTREALARITLRFHAVEDPSVGDQALEVFYREILKRRRDTLPPGTTGLVEVERALAGAVERRALRLQRGARFAEAASAYREVLDLIADAGPPDRRRVAEVRSRLGRCLASLGRTAEAEALLVSAYSDLEKLSGPSSAAVQMTRSQLARLYEATNRPGEASRLRALSKGVTVQEVWDLGSIRFDEALHGRDGGSSTRLGGRSFWIFAGAQMPRGGREGEPAPQAMLAWTDDRNASDGVGPFHYQTDGAGTPIELIPLTSAEAAFNAAHTGPDCEAACGIQWRLTPTAIVADEARDRSIVFLRRVLGDSTGWIQPAGTVLATCSRNDVPCSREVTRPGSEDPTSLFGPAEPAWGSAALAAGGLLYAYACDCPTLDCACLLARAPLESALDRSAWRFFSGGSDWTAEWRNAVPVLEGPIRSGRLSVHPNAYLGKYLAVSSRTLDARIDVRVADRPEGPWSEPVTEIETVYSTPGWFWTFSAFGHPEFARDGGRIEYLTFARNGPVPFTREIRLVEVRLDRR
jgi:serine/threonine protein kinase